MDEAPRFPWICARCGTATNTDACPSCFQERPYEVASYNQPGSYWAIVQGRQGYAGLPRGCGIAMLIVILGPLLRLLFELLVRSR